jgi:hypothetical protein
MYCPSRRKAKAYRVGSNIDFVKKPKLSNTLTVGARNDYAANGGEVFPSFGPGPETLAQGDNGYVFPNPASSTGLVFTRSKFSSAKVVDGGSNTLLIAEKYLNPDNYENGVSLGDDQGPYVSDERDVVRYAAIGGAFQAPIQDRTGVENTWNFGSAHSHGFQAALADGSVRSITFSIDEITMRRLCNRQDRQVLDATRL